MSDAAFGTWAGLAVNDTAQVVATGYAYSPAAGDVATVVKLTRNLAILPVLLGATWWAARSLAAADREDAAVPDGKATKRVGGPMSTLAMVARAVPWFVIGFVVFAALRSLGLLDVPLPTGGTLADLCSTLATLLILVALAGVGLATDIRAMSGVGPRPFLLGVVDVGRHRAARTGARAGLPWRLVAMDIELDPDPRAREQRRSSSAGGREAVVVDPPRDAWRVIAVAEARGWQLTHVVETHVHNDYLSGALELRAALGARDRRAGSRPLSNSRIARWTTATTVEIDGLRLDRPGDARSHARAPRLGGGR